MNVAWIEQGHQHVDIQQRDAHSSSRQRFTISMVSGGAPGIGSSNMNPFRNFGAFFGFNASRTRSEITFPVLVFLWWASSFAAPKISASMSSVVRISQG